MELREFAYRTLRSEDLEVKLASPETPLTDSDPGEPLRLPPGRPAELPIVAGRQVRIPAIDGLADPKQRPRILHGLANHELQAAELFAWALLAFPQAPSGFRRGLAGVLRDEQRHTRMYVERLETLGVRFGAYGVSGYFWNKVEEITSPLRFVCAMSLTFENANLDHTLDYAAAARRAGDRRSAAIFERVHRDEIEHVRFGWTWLRKLKRDDESMWDAYRSSLTWPLRPVKAKGKTFHPSGREAAGLDRDFIRKLEDSRP